MKLGHGILDVCTHLGPSVQVHLHFRCRSLCHFSGYSPDGSLGMGTGIGASGRDGEGSRRSATRWRWGRVWVSSPSLLRAGLEPGRCLKTRRSAGWKQAAGSRPVGQRDALAGAGGAGAGRRAAGRRGRRAAGLRLAAAQQLAEQLGGERRRLVHRVRCGGHGAEGRGPDTDRATGGDETREFLGLKWWNVVKGRQQYCTEVFQKLSCWVSLPSGSNALQNGALQHAEKPSTVALCC